MRRMGFVGSLGAALLASGAGSAVRANDSSAELSIGGLVFTQNADVSMESEDLTITPENVTVKYRFLNQSAAPVTLTVAFPLPDIDLAEFDANFSIPANDPVNFVGFQTKIDGKPVKFDVVQRAFLGTKDISAAVRAAGLPLLPVGAQRSGISGLNEQAREKLVADGLLVPAGTNQNGQTIYNGSWTVKTSVVRKQTFPPGKPVGVEHRYRTSVGLSLDTVLRKAVRETQAMEAELQRYRAQYCVPDELLKGIDKIAGTAEANTAKLQERRISYVLKTGANWAGPIKDFRLVVDKGRADRLVSFCGENVKKISPTAFEMRAKDFTPTQDLKILLISKAEVADARKLPTVDKPVPSSVLVDRPSP